VNELSITLSGNLGRDPELRYTPNGAAVCDFTVAMTPRAKSGDTYFDKETIWFKVACWNQLAENVAATLKKGDKVLVHGRLQQETYERKDGTTGLNLVVKVDAIGPDLWRCPADLKRPVRPGSGADLMPEMWVDQATGEVVTDRVEGSGPLVPFSSEDLDVAV
jgi:single-strand DNA-binding protein